jgi:hypothetical protein
MVSSVPKGPIRMVREKMSGLSATGMVSVLKVTKRTV